VQKPKKIPGLVAIPIFIAVTLLEAARAGSRPLTPEVAGSSPVAPVKFLQIANVVLSGQT
jgi:hypothetical protein